MCQRQSVPSPGEVPSQPLPMTADSGNLIYTLRVSSLLLESPCHYLDWAMGCEETCQIQHCEHMRKAQRPQPKAVQALGFTVFRPQRIPAKEGEHICPPHQAGRRASTSFWISVPLQGLVRARPPCQCTPGGPDNSHLPSMPAAQGGQEKHHPSQWHPDGKKSMNNKVTFNSKQD